MTTAAELLEQPFSTMPDMIRAHAKERPSHRAVIDGERVLTFAEFDALIDRTAATMQRDGVGPHGRLRGHSDGAGAGRGGGAGGGDGALRGRGAALEQRVGPQQRPEHDRDDRQVAVKHRARGF